MNPALILQLVAAAATLSQQIAPMWSQVQAASESGDDAAVTSLLTRLQAVNDQLAAAP